MTIDDFEDPVSVGAKEICMAAVFGNITLNKIVEALMDMFKDGELSIDKKELSDLVEESIEYLGFIIDTARKIANGKTLTVPETREVQ